MGKSKSHYTIEEKIDIIERFSTLNHDDCKEIAEFFDYYTFQTLKDIKKAITIIARGKID